MLKDRVALDLPYYDGLLVGHYRRGPGYASRRAGGTDDWLLVATLAGLGRFGTRLGDAAAPPGTLALISPGTPHDYGTARDAAVWEILWVHFQPPPEWRELLHWPTGTPGVAFLEPGPSAWKEIERSFREVYRLSLRSLRRRRRFAMNALERLLLQCDERLSGAGHPMDDRIRAVVEHIHAHLGGPLSLEKLSKLAHLSPSRFAHLFRAETGMAPLQYVSLQRMRRAATLLEHTTLGVAEIAAEIGMEPFHFSARFKEETGENPRAYRTARANATS